MINYNKKIFINRIDTLNKTENLTPKIYNYKIISRDEVELFSYISSVFARHGKITKMKKLILKSLYILKTLYPTENSMEYIKKALIHLFPYFEIKSKRHFKETKESVIPIWSRRRRIFLAVSKMKKYLLTIKSPFVIKFTQTIIQLNQKQGPLWETEVAANDRINLNQVHAKFRWKDK